MLKGWRIDKPPPRIKSGAGSVFLPPRCPGGVEQLERFEPSR
jgi:hypothetical protein